MAIREQNSDVEIFELGYFYPAGDAQTLIQQVTGLSLIHIYRQQVMTE